MRLHGPMDSGAAAPAARSASRLAVALAVVLAAGAPLLAGCGKKSEESASGRSAAVDAAAASEYDAGPRAGESPVDQGLAEKGEQLFKDKGCSACHTFGQKLTGPDLQGVTMRRTAQWMEHQILRPDVMIKADPIARELMAQFALQMPNQGLTPEEARAVIEYLKHKDQESGEAKD